MSIFYLVLFMAITLNLDIKIINRIISVMPQQSFPFQIRQATLEDAAAIAAVHVKAWQESYRGIVNQDVLDNLLVEERLSSRLKILKNSSGDHFVACLREAIVGFCDAGSAHSSYAKGEIYAIYVLEAYKRQGIGHALFSAATSFLLTQEFYPFLSWVLKANQEACAFYEHQGGKICAGRKHVIASKPYPEVCYRFY